MRLEKHKGITLLSLCILIIIILISLFAPNNNGGETNPQSDTLNTKEEIRENYENRSLECVSTNGNGIFMIGIDKKGEYIYLNPSYSRSKKGNETGYYISASRGYIEVSNDIVYEIDGEENRNNKDFLILGQFYDEIVNAQYKDSENYGIRWCDDISYDGTLGGVTFNIRAVNLIDGDFLGIYEAEIGYNKEKDTYRVESVRKADAITKKEITEEERNTLFDIASEHIEKIADLENETWKEVSKKKVVAEKVEKTYFPKYIKVDGSVGRSYELTGCDIIALNIPVPYYSFVTAYFIKNGTEYELVGTDVLNPRSRDSIFVPREYWE